MSETPHDRPTVTADGRPHGGPMSNAPRGVPPKTGGRPPRHPLYAESFAGLAPWAALAVAGTLLLSLGVLSERWQGSWEQTQSQLQAAVTLLAGPLAAALGCWQGSRERRSRAAELRLSVARSPLAQFAIVALPVVAGVLVGFVVAVAGTLLASWPYTSAGRPLFAPLLALAVFLASLTVIGVVVGRLARWRLTAPALAICLYASLGALSHTSGPARHLSPASSFESAGTVPVEWQPLAMACWTGAMGLAVVLGYAARRRRFALLPLAAAVLAVVPLVQTGEELWRPGPLVNAQVCDDSTPRVCVRAEQRGMLPAVSAELSGLVGRLEGVPHAPRSFVDLSREPRKGEVELPELFIGQSVVRGELAEPERFVWEAAAAVASLRQCRDDAEDLRTEGAVLDWLASNDLSERRRDTSARSALRQGDAEWIAQTQASARASDRLTSMPEERRRAWLGRYFAARDNCDSREVPKL